MPQVVVQRLLSTLAFPTSAARRGRTKEIWPLLEMRREDIVYDAKWSPVRPGVFASVDGAGMLEVWDLLIDQEVPVSRVEPTRRDEDGRVQEAVLDTTRSLNKCAWEQNEGKKVAVGGLDGVVTVFEVGNALGGVEGMREDDYVKMRKLVSRLETAAEAR